MLESLSDAEKKLLAEVAKSRNMSLEDLVSQMRPQPKAVPEQEQVAVFEAPSAPPTGSVAAARTEDDQLVGGTDIPVEPTFSPAESIPDLPTADEEPEPAAKEEIPSEPSTMKHLCVHCGWDQGEPSPANPDDSDKIGYLHCVLGQKVFSKIYTKFGGNLRLQIRSLTVNEIDSLYAETFKAQQAGLIQSAPDYYEYLNRLRVYLQLVNISAQKTALHITLPDGLNPETHPDAKVHWSKFLAENGWDKRPVPEGQSPPSLAMMIMDYINTNVAKTEHLQRVITQTCNEFNRLVVKLEANVDNGPFWETAEPQS